MKDEFEMLGYLLWRIRLVQDPPDAQLSHHILRVAGRVHTEPIHEHSDLLVFIGRFQTS